MSPALLAFVAGLCGVLGAHDAVAELDRRAPLRVLEKCLSPFTQGRVATRGEQRRLAVVATATLGAAGWLVAGPAAAVLLVAAGPLAVRQALAWRTARRRAEIARGAPRVARALADAIAGGHAVRGAIVTASGALTGAAGDELRRAAAALELGERTGDVLDALRERAGDPAYDTLVAAIGLQADAGGDLAALLRGIAARLDHARRDEADARSATAQARFTAWLVAALPAGAAVLAELASPGFLAGLASEPLTAVLAGCSLALQIVAVAAIRAIVRRSGPAVP